MIAHFGGAGFCIPLHLRGVRIQLVVVEGSHWAEILLVNCTRRLSSVEVFDDRGSAHRQREGCGHFEVKGLSWHLLRHFDWAS